MLDRRSQPISEDPIQCETLTTVSTTEKHVASCYERTVPEKNAKNLMRKVHVSFFFVRGHEFVISPVIFFIFPGFDNRSLTGKIKYGAFELIRCRTEWVGDNANEYEVFSSLSELYAICLVSMGRRIAIRHRHKYAVYCSLQNVTQIRQSWFKIRSGTRTKTIRHPVRNSGLWQMECGYPKLFSTGNESEQQSLKTHEPTRRKILLMLTDKEILRSKNRSSRTISSIGPSMNSVNRFDLNHRLDNDLGCKERK